MQSANLDMHSDINLADYLRVINERKWYIIAAMLIVVTVGLIYSLKVTPVYKSSADIEISPFFPSVFNQFLGMMPRNTYEYSQYSKTKIARLKSSAIAEQVQEHIGQKYGLTGYTLTRLRADINAQHQPETYLWVISFEGTEKDDVDKICAEYVKVFIKDNLEERHLASTVAIENIEQEITRLGQEKRQYYKKLLAYRRDKIERHDIYLKPTIYDDATQELSDLNKELDKSSNTKDKLKAILKTFEASRKTGIAVPSSLEGVHWPALENLKKQYLSVYTEYESLGEKYGMNHPRLIETKAEVGSVLRNIEETIKSEIYIHKEREHILLAEKKKQYQKIQILEKIFPAYHEMHEEYVAITLKRNSLTENKTELTPSSHDTTNNMRIINPPPAAFKVKPNLPVNIFLSFILGGIIGIGLAFLREYFDRSIRVAHHFENAFDSPLMCILPFIRKSDEPKDTVVYHREHSIYADVFRLLRTKLLYYNQENPELKVIVVTSPNADEGKTLITCNLALSLQKANKSVLLVDGDLWKARIEAIVANLTGGKMVKNNTKGLSDVLEGSEDLDAVTHKVFDDNNNFYALFSGNSTNSPSEVISPERFSKFVSSVKDKFDFVLIDSPPINEKADGAVIASYCDGVIMVVRRGYTSIESAGNAKRILNDIQANVIGGILNITTLGAGKQYGQYYMYKSYYYKK